MKAMGSLERDSRADAMDSSAALLGAKIVRSEVSFKNAASAGTLLFLEE